VKHYTMLGRSAPIYWQLSVPSRRWSTWVNAPMLSRETLFALAREAEQMQRLTESLVENLQRENESRDRSQKASVIAKQLDDEQRLALELAAFRAESERVANLGWEPDLDDGIVLNAAPLASLFPLWRDAAEYREALRAGKYKWATVARFADQL